MHLTTMQPTQDARTSESSELAVSCRSCHEEASAASTGDGNTLPSTAAKATVAAAYLSHMVTARPVRRVTCTSVTGGLKVLVPLQQYLIWHYVPRRQAVLCTCTAMPACLVWPAVSSGCPTCTAQRIRSGTTMQVYSHVGRLNMVMCALARHERWAVHC